MVKRDGLVDTLRVTADGTGVVGHAGSAAVGAHGGPDRADEGVVGGDGADNGSGARRTIRGPDLRLSS